MNCLLNSFSVVTGVSYDTLVEDIGHDGMEIVWPDAREPYCRRGYHIQEIVTALFDRGFLVVEFEPYPILGCWENDQEIVLENKRFQTIVNNNNGVLCGRLDGIAHAIPKIPGTVINERFTIHLFYAVYKNNPPICKE
jgi:hypothetical protein